ncbi:hypothetical protein [Mycoplana rhizolycopersici]|jgi:hypothetical protein|uniref:Uncharacterized protein n=1 Tax=Mycoplana rhizolycopersici TaxID=2746702 RepID=A0ABX2QP90_9HYPH|nr:hypothetical protein [Rhizobium rhizolycopersici]NVP58368.1 hypothetical protein [Rhizobium rhizolycopersici]
MASPWKFLARLVSPRRQQRQEDGPIEDVKADALGIAGSTEKAAEERLNSLGLPGGEKPQPFDRSDALSAALGPLEETGSDVHGTVERDSATEVVKVSGPALSDIGVALAYGTPKVEETPEAASAKRRRRVRSVETGVVVSQNSPAAPTVSDEMISLDEEIRILRGQMASKLRLQNAQLRKMLERFER